MTRQPIGTVQATTEPLLVFQPSVSSEGTHQALRHRHEKPGSTTVVTARCDRTVGCSHHWIIEAAMLPLSKGVCRVCGEEKLFRNQLSWEEITPVRAANNGGEANRSPNPLQQREYHPFLLPRNGYRRSCGA
jgi:hypothetical protein